MAALTKTGHDTTTSSAGPWAVQQPYLQQGFDAAQQLWAQPGPAYFPGSTVAGFSPEQTESQQDIMNIADTPSPVMGAANQYAYDVLTGKYQENPWGGAVFNNIESNVMPAVNSQYMMAGRLGSGNYADRMTRALTEAYSPWASQNWQFGQDKMAEMAKYAPDLRKMDYFDAATKGLVGQDKQSLAQKEIDDARARWDYYQNLPQNRLSQYMGTVGGTNWGNTSSTTTPVTRPTGLGEALGAGLSIAGAAGDIFGGGGLFGSKGIFG